MKRPGSPRRSTGLKRTAMKRWRKPKRTLLERDASAAWYETVNRRAVVLLSSVDPPGEHILTQAHHPIPRQVCRAHGAPEWDPRNGMKVSMARHRRHHSRHEPITRDELPVTVREFAREHGLEAWFDRHYPEMCPDCKLPVSTHELYREARCPVVRMPAT